MTTAIVGDNQSTINNQQSEIANSLLTFNDAIELSGNLEIIGTSNGQNRQSSIVNRQSEEFFVIRDHSKAEGIEGAFIEVSISEIVEKVTEFSDAMQFVDTINNVRKAIVLHGITRIVGYYSRVNNWNKSKVGELRDRANGAYGLTGKKQLFQTDRLKAIDSL